MERDPCPVIVRDNNVDQAPQGPEEEDAARRLVPRNEAARHYEKPSEKRARQKAEAVRRARKLARKRAQRAKACCRCRRSRPARVKQRFQVFWKHQTRPERSGRVLFYRPLPCRGEAAEGRWGKLEVEDPANWPITPPPSASPTPPPRGRTYFPDERHHLDDMPGELLPPAAAYGSPPPHDPHSHASDPLGRRGLHGLALLRVP